MTNGQRHDGPLRRRIVGVNRGFESRRSRSTPSTFSSRNVEGLFLKAYRLVAPSPRRDDATGEESRGVAAVRSAAAEYARKGPRPSPEGDLATGGLREGSTEKGPAFSSSRLLSRHRV
jgi:hypothetical protein